jgi:hypothetical protein
MTTAPRQRVTRMGLVLAVSLISVAGFGQGRPPRVRELRHDQAYPALDGCGNDVMYLERYRNIFISDNDGNNARMDLNGRNVQLKLIKVRKLGRKPDSRDSVTDTCTGARSSM